MARRPAAVSEFAGTDGGNDGGSSGAIDPTKLAGGTGAGTGDGGTAGGDGDDFDPAIHEGRDKRNADGSYRRKRGRKAGAGSAAKSTAPISVSGIEAVLVSMHGIMAAAIKVPELALAETEAAALAAAVAEVSRHYPMTIDPKTLAWFNLAGCAATIYGPRIYLAKARISNERAARKSANGSATVGVNMVMPADYVGGIGPIPDAVN